MNKKSVPPPKVWWGDKQTFGTSVSVDSSSQYKQFLLNRRLLVNSHKSMAKRNRATEKAMQQELHKMDGFREYRGNMVKLVKRADI